jgi:hypothetical protein
VDDAAVALPVILRKSARSGLGVFEKLDFLVGKCGHGPAGRGIGARAVT